MCFVLFRNKLLTRGRGLGLLMLAYRRGEGGQHGEKVAYVICECSLRTKILVASIGFSCMRNRMEASPNTSDQ